MNGRTPLHFLRRISIKVATTSSVPLSSVALGVGFGVNLPSLDPTQALRIIAGAQQISDAGSSQHLTALGVSATMSTRPGGALLRAWSAPVTNVLLGTIGVRFGWIDDELVYGNDYIESIGTDTPGAFAIFFQADISNSDGAAAHAVTIQGELLVEMYQREILRIR